MIKVVSKAFNEKAHDSTNIPDISYPIVLHKTKPTPLQKETGRSVYIAPPGWSENS